MEQERITHVAIKLADGTIVSLPKPARHSSVLLQCQAKGFTCRNSTQGFLTSKGRFVTREEAYPIAVAAGQLIGREQGGGTSGRLYSEDVW